MKNKPELQLVGHDGNIYAIMGSAARLLRQNGMKEESDEMFKRVTSSGSYEEALRIVSEYVQTEISRPDGGILEAEDISIDTEFTYENEGITAYVNTWFDVKEKFPISLDDAVITEAVKNVFDMTPAGIIRAFGLNHPIFEQTATYGHFTDPSYPWEKTNRRDELRIVCSDINKERWAA